MLTAPASILLILTPFMSRQYRLLEVFILGIFGFLVHCISFAENSLHDYIAGYDLRDKSKAHHPLCTRQISVRDATLLVHWGLPLLMLVAITITLLISPNPVWALVSLCFWYAWGQSYNLGLDKESPLAFVPISLCFSFMAAWAWLLSHPKLTLNGWVFIAYVFCTILYQISYSGNLKEMQLRERSNILTKMGAKLDVNWKGQKIFKPGRARFYAYLVKITNLFLGGLLLYLNWSLVRCVIWIILAGVISFKLYKTTKPRIYKRGKELLNMSLMEIFTIYLPIPLMLGLLEASILMVGSAVYFFAINMILWGEPYPRV